MFTSTLRRALGGLVSALGSVFLRRGRTREAPLMNVYRRDFAMWSQLERQRQRDNKRRRYEGQG